MDTENLLDSTPSPTHFIIAKPDAGKRADAFIAQQLGVSRSRAQSILETVTIGGKVVKSSYTLREGDEITLPELEAEDSAEEIAVVSEQLLREAPEIPIIFEDDSILVVNKPAGVTVHAGAGETGATLVDILRSLGKPLSSVGPTERAGILHRLDKDTSGVMVVAKTDAAHWKLAADFEARLVQKTYFALVCGVPPTRGRIEAAIARHGTQRKKMTISPAGRMSVTEYETAQKWDKFAALDINLLTGRTHQIRVHLAYLHHPVVGDGVYGGLHRALNSAPNEAARRAMELLNGQALHARRLAFAHPISGERLEFEAPLPPKIEAIVQALNDGQS